MPRKRKHGEQLESFTVSTRITISMRKILNEYLTNAGYVSLADYVRDLIRRDLETKGYRLYSVELKVKEAEDRNGSQ